MLMIVGLNIFRFCMRAKLRARQKCNTNSSPECSHRQKRHRASLRRALFLLSPIFLHAIVPSPKMDSEDLFSLVFQFQATHFFPNLFISQLIPFAPLRAVLALQRAIRGRIVLCLGGEGPREVWVLECGIQGPREVWDPGTYTIGSLAWNYIQNIPSQTIHIKPWMLFCSPNEIIWWQKNSWSIMGSDVKVQRTRITVDPCGRLK